MLYFRPKIQHYLINTTQNKILKYTHKHLTQTETLALGSTYLQVPVEHS